MDVDADLYQKNRILSYLTVLIYVGFPTYPAFLQSIGFTDSLVVALNKKIIK